MSEDKIFISLVIRSDASLHRAFKSVQVGDFGIPSEPIGGETMAIQLNPDRPAECFKIKSVTYRWDKHKNVKLSDIDVSVLDVGSIVKHLESNNWSVAELFSGANNNAR